MWTKIKPHVPWDIVEFFFFVTLFMLINQWVFDGKEASYSNMIAGCALYIGISTRRKFEKGEYK